MRPSVGYEARSGEQQDVASRYWRQRLKRMARPGVCAAAKRSMRRSGRRHERNVIAEQLGDVWWFEHEMMLDVDTPAEEP